MVTIQVQPMAGHSRRDVFAGLAGASLLLASGSARGQGAATARTSSPPFLRGMNFGYLSKQGYYGSAEALAQIPLMKAAGVTWVSLMVMLMQETFYSTRIYRDFQFTPDDLELTKLIRAFKDAGIKVVLKPVIDVQDSAWRGRITFPVGDEQIQGVRTDYWSPWFASMKKALLYYARLAERERCEAFTVAQELYGADAQTAHWLEMIDAVKGVYSGALVVNIDGRSVQSDTVDPALIAWVRKLDAVGISFYPRLELKGTAAVAQIKTALEPERLRLARLAQLVGRPIYFAECGARSVENALLATGEYRNVGPYDGQVQANYIQALLETFWNERWWAGFQLWKWDEQQDRPQYHQAGGDAGFTIVGKPAERVLAEWSRRPDPIDRLS